MDQLFTPTIGKPHKVTGNRYRVAINMGTGPDGKRRRVSVTRRTRKAALEAAQEKVDEIKSGVKIDGPRTTVIDWLDYWHSHVLTLRKLRPNSLRSYKTQIDNSIVPHLGDIQLGRLTAVHVREMHASLAKQGLAVSTTALAHIVLNKALDDAVKDGMIAKNPAEHVDQPSGDREERPALTIPQVRQLLKSCDEAEDPLTVRYMMALITGARQGEVLGLTWDRVDFENRTINLAMAMVNVGYMHGCGLVAGCPGLTAATCPSRRPKVPRGYAHIPLSGSLVLGSTKTSGSTRIVPLIAPMEVALLRHRNLYAPGRHNLVWAHPKTGEPVHPRTDHAHWKRALDRAGLPKVPLHSARHTAATLLQDLHVEEAVRMKILGHNSQTEHRGYAHVDVALAREALEGYGKVLELGA